MVYRKRVHSCSRSGLGDHLSETLLHTNLSRLSLACPSLRLSPSFPLPACLHTHSFSPLRSSVYGSLCLMTQTHAFKRDRCLPFFHHFLLLVFLLYAPMHNLNQSNTPPNTCTVSSNSPPAPLEGRTGPVICVSNIDHSHAKPLQTPSCPKHGLQAVNPCPIVVFRLSPFPLAVELSKLGCYSSPSSTQPIITFALRTPRSPIYPSSVALLARSSLHCAPVPLSLGLWASIISFVSWRVHYCAINDKPSQKKRKQLQSDPGAPLKSAHSPSSHFPALAPP